MSKSVITYGGSYEREQPASAARYLEKPPRVVTIMDEAPNLAPEPGASDFGSDYQLTIPAHLRARLEAKAKEARLPFDDFAIQCLERSIEVMNAEQTLW